MAGKCITREALGRVLNVDNPHRDIIFTRFNKRLHADSISYAEFIEEVTPKTKMW